MAKFCVPKPSVCLVCMLHPILLFLSWYGAPAVPKCPHFNKKSTLPRLHHSKPLPYLYILLAIAIPSTILSDEVAVFTSKQFHLEKTLQLIAIIPAIGFLLTILAHSLTSVRIDVFNSIQSLCEHHQFYQIPNLINPQTAKMVNRLLWTAAIATLSTQLFTFLLLGYRNLLSSLCSMFVVLCGINAVTYDLILSVLLKRLLRFCCEDVKKMLEQKMHPQLKTGNIVNSLRRKKMLYLSIIGNWERLSSGFFVMYTVFFLFGVTHLIVAFYVIVGLQLEETKISFQMKSYLIESTTQALTFCIVLVIYDLSRSQIEDIVSFLFKYPSRKLCKEEELEVENFIKILTVKQPHLCISEMFTVRVQLLSTLSGTVLTYVLIAVQFHLHAGKQV